MEVLWYNILPKGKIMEKIEFREIIELFLNTSIHQIKSLSRNLAMQIMRRIWLRMGTTDIENIVLFLEK